MAWRGRTTALELHNIEEFKTYLHGLNYNNWRPSGIVQHNTASPTLHQWWHSVPPAQRMQNLISYYRDELGWSAGPHAFVDGVSIWVLTDFNVSGVHSPSWNATRLGIEMVGDYDTEDDESGGGKKVLDMSTALFGECCAYFGWEPNNDKIKQHKEDPATDHDCPGRNVVKSEFLADVTQYMGDGGDHTPDPPDVVEVIGVVYNLAAGDTLNIRAAASTSAPIIGVAENGDIVTVVGEAYNSTTRWFRLRFGDPAGTGVGVHGWASASYIKRDESEIPAEETDWRTDITATVFGMAGDEQDSAYPDVDWIGPATVGVSFPYKWRDVPRPASVLIESGSRRTEAPIVDVGPWNTDDPRYVLEGRRPMVEKQYAMGLEAQNGRVPTNDAAIDLTVPVATALGISGKGVVRWKFKT
jgi:hypothetical protein